LTGASETLRRCQKCGQEKPRAAFYRDKQRKDGIATRCRSCDSKRSKHYYRLNREERLARHRRWQKANPDKWYAAVRSWARRNRDKTRRASNACNKRRYHANPVVGRAKSLAAYGRRRALKAAVEVGEIDYERIRRRDRMRCHMCRLKVSEEQLHFDHVIPLVAGGAHTESNIAVSHAQCNLSKNRRVLTLF
jgi:5-methylcytosine-specific restriction endonuclease McrA